jgi:tetratricopeptide (TPR) repeat protein
MGGVFWLGGLLAISRLDEPTPQLWGAGDMPDLSAIKDHLKELVERDYVLRLPDSTFPTDEEYVFKHNLEREALMRLTPPAVARRLHHAIADWLAFRDHVRTHEEYVGMLARHRERAGAISAAATSYLDAADVARERYANGKAAEYYVKGLSLMSEGEHGFPQSGTAGSAREGARHKVDADAEKRIRALHHYGDVLQQLGRNEEALVAFREMLTSAFRLDLRTKGGAAHSRIGRLYRETGRLDEAQKHLSAALALFEESEDDRGIASTTDDIG